ncbi:MAG: lactate racemase domain-containing protein [Synergistaceae bacterium]
MGFIDNSLSDVKLPKIVKVCQYFDKNKIEDIEGCVRQCMKNSLAYQRINPGQRIAVTAGSRGIDNIALITKIVCFMIKEKGAVPFIVPAMGSHGGATAKGQLHMLEINGMTEETMGVPILSSMETAMIGELENGDSVYIDKNAHEADGIVLINRVKAHTSFKGKYESGLMKMMTIGLGKQYGAQHYHQRGYGFMPWVIENVGKRVLVSSKIICGIAVVENGYGKTNIIECIDAADIPRREAELLIESYKHLSRPFFKEADVMVVKEIGKNISGVGCDSNISGRFNNEHFHNDIHITRVGFLELSKKSDGNANGMGLADFITQKFYDNVDFEQTYPNALTSTATVNVKVPMILSNDKNLFAVAVKTSCIADFDNVRLAIIESSKNMTTIYVSENMAEEAIAAGMEVCGEPFEIPFSKEGALELKFL